MGNELVFDWRFGVYGLHACPKRLARFSDDEPNATIDFVKYYKQGDREFCCSIGYFYWNEHEPCWELKFVGDRFCEVENGDISLIWPMLKAAYQTLTEWKERQDDEDY